MAITLIGRHFDANVYRKVTALSYDNLQYDVANENFSHYNVPDSHGVYRSGSPWLLNKIQIVKKPSESVTSWWGNFPIYEGQFVAPTPVLPPVFSLDDLESYGPEMWNRMKPDRPLMDLGQALGELKDVPHMLKQRFEFTGIKDVASFNLAVNFGWIPLLSDTRKFVDSHHKLNDALKRLLRNSGRPVRRRIPIENNHSVDEYDVTSTSAVPSPGFSNPVLVTQGYGSGFTRVNSVKFKKRLWASGQFRYWLPDQGNLTELQYRKLLMRRLYGLRPSPKLIYELMPWSWLLDWFTNVGDNIDNLNEHVVERLICDYAFIMRSVEAHSICKVTGPIHTGPGAVYTNVSATTTAIRLVKERGQAHPFGFQINTEDLSPYQLTIASSLALAR